MNRLEPFDKDPKRGVWRMEGPGVKSIHVRVKLLHQARRIGRLEKGAKVTSHEIKEQWTKVEE